MAAVVASVVIICPTLWPARLFPLLYVSEKYNDIRLDRSFKLNRAISNQSKEAITSAENKEILKGLRGQKSVSI